MSNKPIMRDIRGSITPGSMEPATTNIGEGVAFDAVAGYPAGVTRPMDYPVLEKPETSVLTPMQQWAQKYEDTLAPKVKPGQAGYEEIQQYLNRVTEADVLALKDDSFGYTKEESEAYLNPEKQIETVIDGSDISTSITTPQIIMDTPEEDPQRFLRSRIEYLTRPSKEIIYGMDILDKYFENLP